MNAGESGGARIVNRKDEGVSNTDPKPSFEQVPSEQPASVIEPME